MKKIYGKWSAPATNAFLLLAFLAVTMIVITNGSTNNLGVYFFSDQPHFALLFAVLVVLAVVAVTIVWYVTGSLQRANVWLKYAWITCAIALAALVSNIYVLDAFQFEKFAIQGFGENIKEIFGFVTTLYAFVAGFLLLFALQEYSAVDREFRNEIDAWHNIHNLLKFFLARKDDVMAGKLSDSEKLNDHAVRKCFSEMRGLKEDEEKPAKNPTEVLDKVYTKILELEINDANDREALGVIIPEYCKLRVLLRQRSIRKIDSPKMLVIQLWLVAALAIFFASLAVASLFKQDYILTPGGQLTFFVSMFLLVMPITLVNMTIQDLKSPFSGEWKIDVKTGYENLSKSLTSLDPNEDRSDDNSDSPDKTSQDA